MLCHYIVRYPVVVEEAARLKPVGAAGLHTEAGLQKACHRRVVLAAALIVRISCIVQLPQFLTRLSHTLSAYYSRVRILLVRVRILLVRVRVLLVRVRILLVRCPSLQPPEPHLLPLTFARLHLATALRGLMCHALSLLDIRPLDRL